MSGFDRGVRSDCLDLLAREPAAVRVWHRLFQATTQAQPDDVQAVLTRVRADIPLKGFGGFLAATFCYQVSGSVSDLASASRVFINGQLPSDAGLALVHLVYSAALGSGQHAAGFASLVRDSGALDVLAVLGRRLVDTPQPAGDRRNPKVRPLRRVAVVVPTLSTVFHAPTHMALRHAGLLVDSGLEVALFAAQEFQMLDMPHWLGVPKKMEIAAATPQSWPRPQRKLLVSTAPLPYSMQRRWSHLLQSIAAFAPDVVLFMGPYSPLLFALYQSHPVVGLGTNALAPMGPLDAWLAPQPDARSSWEPDIPAGKPVPYSHRFDAPAVQTRRPRTDLGLPDAALVWVTTGTRLGKEMGAAWLSRVLQLLDQCPQCHWLIVGLNSQQLEAGFIHHPRVILRGFDPELPAVLNACDLYLNPPRMGGGFSVVTAMALGLPVLGLQGSDGGDKLGPWAQPDDDHYFQALKTLTEDAEQRGRLAKALRKRYADAFDLTQGAPTLMSALAEAANSRIKPSAASR